MCVFETQCVYVHVCACVSVFETQCVYVCVCVCVLLINALNLV